MTQLQSCSIIMFLWSPHMSTQRLSHLLLLTKITYLTPSPKEMQENLEKDTLITWFEIFWTDIIFEAFFPEIKQKKFRWKFFQAAEMNTKKEIFREKILLLFVLLCKEKFLLKIFFILKKVNQEDNIQQSKLSLFESYENSQILKPMLKNI